MARFGIKFCLIMALYYAVVLVPFFDRLLYAYLEANAWISNSIINLLGQESHVSEVTIRSPHFAIAIRRGCDAIEPAWFLCAAVLSFPARFGLKLKGMLIGTSAILALNLVRIVSLFFIGLHWPALFAVSHLEIWPAAFILVALLIWVGWIKWAGRKVSSESHAAA